MINAKFRCDTFVAWSYQEGLDSHALKEQTLRTSRLSTADLLQVESLEAQIAALAPEFSKSVDSAQQLHEGGFLIPSNLQRIAT